MFKSKANAKKKLIKSLSPASQNIIFMVQNDTTISDSTRRIYLHALMHLFLRHSLEEVIYEPDRLTEYTKIAPANYLTCIVATLKKWLRSEITQLKAGASPENVIEIQAKIYNLEAMLDNLSVAVKPSKKTRPKVWLSDRQIEIIYKRCPDTPKGWRDSVALGMMIDCGLRVNEVVSMKFEDIVEQPIGSETKFVFEFRGKGNKLRTVPLPDDLFDDIMEWQDWLDAEDDEFILRSFDRFGFLYEKMSRSAVRSMVRRYGKRIGVRDLAPHSLRRTFATRDYVQNGDIVRTSRLMGHSNVSTTQVYLKDAINDYRSTGTYKSVRRRTGFELVDD